MLPARTLNDVYGPYQALLPGWFLCTHKSLGQFFFNYIALSKVDIFNGPVFVHLCSIATCTQSFRPPKIFMRMTCASTGHLLTTPNLTPIYHADGATTGPGTLSHHQPSHGNHLNRPFLQITRKLLIWLWVSRLCHCTRPGKLLQETPLKLLRFAYIYS